MKFEGALSAILDSLGDATPAKGTISGKPLRLPGRGITAWLGKDSQDKAHLLFPVTALNERAFPQSRYLSAGFKHWVVGKHPKPAVFLDICLERGAENYMFLRFCEDLLGQLEKAQGSLLDCAINCLHRWLAFWKAKPAPFTDEWLRGIYAELHFLKQLLEATNSESIHAWRGPRGEHQDFWSTNCAVEVKSVSSSPATVQINTVSQLECRPGGKLFLLAIWLQESKSGRHLSQLIESIARILPAGQATEEFWQSLAMAGYHPLYEKDYCTKTFVVADAKLFPVDSRFPKIVPLSFREPLDRRVKAVRYLLELSGLNSFPLSCRRGLAVVRSLGFVQS